MEHPGSRVGHGKNSIRCTHRRALHQGHGGLMINRQAVQGIPDTPAGTGGSRRSISSAWLAVSCRFLVASAIPSRV
jgi:hypothetical protein